MSKAPKVVIVGFYDNTVYRGVKTLYTVALAPPGGNTHRDSLLYCGFSGSPPSSLRRQSFA